MRFGPGCGKANQTKTRPALPEPGRPPSRQPYTDCARRGDEEVAGRSSHAARHSQGSQKKLGVLGGSGFKEVRDLGTTGEPNIHSVAANDNFSSDGPAQK